MASGIYSRYKSNLMNKICDMEADTINVMLLDSSHSFAAANTVIGDVDANEVAGTGYVAGGAALAGKAVTEAATTKFDATDLTWSTASITAAHAVIYDITATSNLIASIDFGGDVTSSAGDFTIQWHADGIITLA